MAVERNVRRIARNSNDSIGSQDPIGFFEKARKIEPMGRCGCVDQLDGLILDGTLLSRTKSETSNLYNHQIHD